MTREDIDFIGAMNMCDEISNEAYRKIMIHCEEEQPCTDAISRQAVLEKAYKIAGYDRSAYVVDVADIEALSSVKPCADAISRQAVRDMLKDINADTDGVGFYYEHYDEYIKNLPSVSTEKTGRWIPVSEKLPEDMQRVLVWFEYYRYGDYNCMYQTYGFGYVCDGKWSPFINGETGWQDTRIIAWMPLPQPYKGESEDKG